MPKHSGGHRQPPKHTCPHPWAPVLVTSNTPGGHLQPLLHTCPHPMGTRSQVLQTLQVAPKGHPFSCKYFKHSRWPPPLHVSWHGHPFSWAYFNTPGGRSSRYSTRSLVPCARSRVSISNTLVSATASRCFTRPLNQWTPILVQVFQTLQVATPSRHCPRVSTRSTSVR